MDNKLIQVAKYLNDCVIDVCESHDDGRVNSITDENTIIDILEEQYGKSNIIRPEAREWYDVKIFGHPINIKSSNCTTNDNFSSKKSLLYALTQLSKDEIDNCRTWQDFQNLIRDEGKEENHRDFYIIVLNKKTNEVYLESLKTLKTITPNGSNIPFQVNWEKNKKPVIRTHKEAYDFLIGTYKKSIEKKLKAFDGYETL